MGCIAFWTNISPFALFLNQKILSYLRNSSLPKHTHRGYTVFIVVVTASAFAFQVFQMGDSYFQYLTANTINFDSKEAIEIPVLDFCFPSHLKNPKEFGISGRNFTLLQIHGNTNLIKKTRQALDASTVYYTIYGMHCHSNTANNDRRRSANMLHTEYGSYEEDDTMDMSDIMIFIPSSSLRHKYTKLRSVYVTMHQQKDLVHDPADNVYLKPFAYKKNRFFSFTLAFNSVTQYLMPLPYDTSCIKKKHRIRRNQQTLSSRQCFESCYSSSFIEKYKSFPFDVPQFMRVNEKSMQTSNETDTQDTEGMKEACHMKCRNDCYQVHSTITSITYLSNLDTIPMSFKIKRAKQEIVIRYSAQISFWDLISVIVNAASFYFTFCPATLLLSKRCLSLLHQNEIKKERATRRTPIPGMASKQWHTKAGVRIAWA